MSCRCESDCEKSPQSKIWKFKPGIFLLPFCKLYILILFSQALHQVCQRRGLGEGVTVIPVSVLKPPAAARYPPPETAVWMCVHRFALIHSCLQASMCTCVCIYVCVCQSIQLMHSSQMESGLWRRPCCLDYWVCQNCEGNKRGKRESERGQIGEEHLVFCHTHTKTLLEPEGNFLLEFIQKSLNNSGTPVVWLWHMYRCAPPRGPPVLSSKDVSWKPLSDPGYITSVGPPIVQKASSWEAWLHRGSVKDKGAGSLIFILHACVRAWVLTF